MIKLYCDRCGREINGDVFNIKIEYANDIQDKSIMTSSINDDFQNFLRNERIYCERCTGEIREALEPLEASEPESRDECDINAEAIFMKELNKMLEKLPEANVEQLELVAKDMLLAQKAQKITGDKQSA